MMRIATTYGTAPTSLLTLLLVFAISGSAAGERVAQRTDGPSPSAKRLVDYRAAVIRTNSEIEPGLADILETTPADESVSALVFMSVQVDLDALTAQLDRRRAKLAERHETVVLALQELAETTQGDLHDHLMGLAAEGLVEQFKPHWISNCFRVDAIPEVIEEIAGRPDVGMVYYNDTIELIEPTDSGPDQGARGDRAPEIGLVAVRAPEAWALGFTGEGVLVSTLDTGVDGSHPALASRWRGVADPRYAGHPEWAFFDPYTGWTFPQDSGSHGTHTMGTVCGGAPGDEVGVAPGAQWIHAATIDRGGIEQTVNDSLDAFEWLIDPDGDPGTNWDVPAVCSNSWGLGTWHGYPHCDETFWSHLDACEAAGIVILFSAGNEGSSPNTLRSPPDRATDDYRTCAVGGIDANSWPSWSMYSSSSRGPTYCTLTGDPAIKPEIGAPAVSVRSSVPGGSYSSYSGTSMASPHVNGVVALIRQACPDLTVQDVKDVMYETALDLGPAGNDNDLGHGLVDAYEAVLLAASMCGDSPPRVTDASYDTAVDTSAMVTLLASDYDGNPDPPGAMTYEIISLPETGNFLTDPGNDHVIIAGDLPYELIGGGNEVLYTPTGQFYGNDTFQFIADDGGVPPEGGDSDPGTITVVVMFGPPVITTTSLPEGYEGVEYGPVQLEAAEGQPELDWIALTAGEYFEADMGSSLFTVVGDAQGWAADDGSWPYTLPFSFPYYGGEYNSVNVCTNGFIDFESSSTAYSNSDSELISNARVAALWDDLDTRDTGMDIHIDDSAAGEVTFRWDTETLSGDHPCNFSIKLYEDGTIQFHYGSGNTGLTPTIGVSAGDGVNYTLAAYNNAGSLPNANSLEFTMPSLMPEGLVVSAGGVISGYPSELGAFTPTFRVTDSLGRSDQAEIPLVISEPIFGDIVLADSFTKIRGEILSGGLEDLHANDDSRLVVRLGFVLNATEPPVWLTVEGTSTVAEPSELRFFLEDHMSVAGMFAQTIALYDYDAQAFEVVDVRGTMTADSLTTVLIEDNAGRFVDPGTLEMKAQLTWIPTGFIAAFPWEIRIDRAIWSTVP